MSFGNDYQDMSDREILVEMATKLSVLEGKVDDIQCPSPNCHQHDKRIMALEKDAETRKEAKLGFQAWITILTAIVMGGMALILQVIDMWRR